MRFTLGQTVCEPKTCVSLEESIDGVYVCLDGIPVMNFAKKGIWRYYLEPKEQARLLTLDIPLETLEPLRGTYKDKNSWRVIAIDPGKEK